MNTMANTVTRDAIERVMHHIQALTQLDGVSGDEGSVRQWIQEKLAQSPAKIQVTCDPMGNLIAEVQGKQRAKHRLMLAAHMDEVGLIITGITAEGYLRFDQVGGIDPSVLIGRTVKIGEVYGVIGCKAIHQTSKEDRSTLPKIDHLLIDIGAKDRETAEKVVNIGDTAVFDSDFTPLEQGRFKARALDDRAGCALLLELVREVPPYDLVLAFTTQEEVGLRGATTAAYTAQPQMAVVVEATTAADVAGVPEDRQVCRMGGGAVVSFMDKRTLYDRELYNRIMDLAAEHGIAVQPKTMVAGGNDAGAIQSARGGVRVAAVSLPCRYIHSPSCVLSEKDVEQTLALLQCLCRELPAL